MNKLYILMGLPGIGKSSYAERKMRGNNNMIMVSSDDFREVLLKDIMRQNENNFIFDAMKTVAINALKDDKDVIYDATNLERSRRAELVSNIRQAVEKPIEVVGIYLAGAYKMSIDRNKSRERQVPEDIIKRLAKKCDIPTARDCYFDNILYEYNGENKFTDIWKLVGEDNYVDNYDDFSKAMLNSNKYFTDCYELSQDCKFHTLSVSRHTYEAFKLAKKNVPMELQGHLKHILYAIAFHDIGKGLCKDFHKKSKYAHFTGHERVSAQIFLEEAMRQHTISTDKTINPIFVASLIAEHMALYNGETIENIQMIYGADFAKCLAFINECDEGGK